MDLAELQQIAHDWHNNGVEIRELQDELEKTTASWHRASRKNQQLTTQVRLMVKFISQTQEFYRFIVMREWKANATDKDMVMAFLADMVED